ncbi:MAG: FHA domain-containing protein [Myxococcota bacterium]
MGRRRRTREDDDEFTERTSTTAVYEPGDGDGRPTSYQPAFILRLTRGPGAPVDITLTDDHLVIGRSQSCGIFVDSPELSRNHVQLEKQGHEYTLTDLESRNGVFLNGVRIHSAVLRSGDTLQMGNVTFLYLEGF